MEQCVRVATTARALAIAAAGWLLVCAICGDAVAQRLAAGGDQYFIDFRARRSHYIGHTYIVYFRVGAGGRVIEEHHEGLIPEEDVWNGVFSPIRASIRKYKDDTRMPATVIYRRELSAAEFARVGRAVAMLKATQNRWHVIFYNCNDFAIEIAEALGLWRPPSLLPPSVMFLKRIIGLPGETVHFHAGHVWINGRMLEESYVVGDWDWDSPPVTLESNQFYVVGDNRTMPESMHEEGRARRDHIVGRILLCKSLFVPSSSSR